MDPERHTTARVFISATSGDLASVREIVKQGLLTMHCLPVEQTNFGPDYRTVTEMLEGRIGECDAVVHIVGLRYGAEPDPATLPASTARRSYTQMEADIARRLKKKLYLFVCPEDFPYDRCEPEPEDKVALQRAYRAEVAESTTIRTKVTNREDVAQRVRELQLEVEKIRTQMGRQRRRGLVFGTFFVLLLGTLAAAVWWNSRHTLEVVQRIAQDYDPERIEANLRKQIRQRAEEEIKKLDPVNDWRKAVEIEKAREQQLADVDRLMEQMHQAFENQQVSANYALASKILAEKGVEEALQFLAAKDGERQDRIGALKRRKAADEAGLRKVLREKLLAASLLEKNLQADQAEAQYRAVMADDPTWAEPRNALAWLLSQRGALVAPGPGNALLREAADLCRATLAATPQAAAPQDWAMAQAYLANALVRQGERAGGADTQRLMDEAVAAYREALKVYTREQFPQAWASMQNDLGIALKDQGERTAGAEAQARLAEAVAAYREALQVYTREKFPQDWASTQNNLGNALYRQAGLASGADAPRLLGEAVAAYREALQVRTQEEFPQDWASTQNNLAIALLDQGERADGAAAEQLLTAAVEGFRAVLQVRTREQSPQAWASTQNNLATALSDQGERATGADAPRLLGEAVTAYREALKVYTREQLPQQWAITQNNLGTVLWDQGLRVAGADCSRLLGEAADAFRESLQVYTRTQFPQQWAMTQNNLGNALLNQGQRAAGTESDRLLGEAVAAYRAALEVRTRAQFPQQWASTQNNLATALTAQGVRAGPSRTGEEADGPRLLGEAVAVLREALQVNTREQLPYGWAQTQRNLSIALKLLAKATGGDEGQKQQAEAEAIDRELSAAQGK